jgi:hypothetical protein
VKTFPRCTKRDQHHADAADYFFASAEVSQVWIVDAEGNWISTAEDCSSVLQKPERDRYECAVAGCDGEVEWVIDAERQINAEDFEIDRELVLNTAHITLLDAGLLSSEVDAYSPDFIVYEHSGYAWRVNIAPESSDYFAEIKSRLAALPEANRYSSSFWKCIDLALALGVRWVRFDRDGDIHLTDILDRHEW